MASPDSAFPDCERLVAEHKKYCSQCRSSEDETPLKRCARCKLTFYCSRDCQRKHYSQLHKDHCLHMAQLLRSREESNQNRPLEVAETIFQIAYRSCDTVERGAHILAKALPWYEQADPLSPVLALLLVALGHLDEGMIKLDRSLAAATETDEEQVAIDRKYDLFPSDENVPEETTNQLRRLSDDHLVVLMLLKMKLLMQLRQEHAGDDADADMNKTQQERQLGVIIAQFQDASVPLQIRDSFPFFDPNLFVSNIQRDLLLFLQDCFMMTPGLNDLLHEFLEEEQYE